VVIKKKKKMILDLIALNENSRVWLYQANRELNDQELELAREQLYDFLDQWTAHSSKLYCYGNIFHRRFLGIFVDETATGASGCSIDSSVRFIEQMGRQLNVDFFDRMNVYYLDEQENVHGVALNQLVQEYQEAKVNDETIFFNNLVKTKKEFLTSWTVPLKDTWISRYI